MRNQMSLYLSVETVETVETVANPFSTRGIDPYYPDLFATNEEKNSVETVENDFFVTVSTELNSKSVANLLGSSGKSVPAYRETSLRLTKKRCVGD